MALLKKKTESKQEAKSGSRANFAGLKLVPRISEKSGKLSQSGKYVFVIPSGTNKIEVKKAVEKNYKVHVIQVNITVNKPKAVRFGQREGVKAGFKKAIVTLRKGETLEQIK